MFNDTECEGDEKVPNIHEGSASGNLREMEPVLSPYKEKGGTPPFTEVTEHAILCLPDTRPLYNKNGEVEKYCVATGIIVTPTVTGKNPAAVILSIEPFNSKLRNKIFNRGWRMDIGDISYGLGT